MTDMPEASCSLTFSLSRAKTEHAGEKQAAEPPAPQPAQAAVSAAEATPPQSDAAAAPDDSALFDPSLNTRKRKPGLNLFQLGGVPQEHQDAVHMAEAARQENDRTPAAPPPAEAPGQLFSRQGRAPVPDIEWWDAAVLAQATYEPQDDGLVLLKENKISCLIEHPVPIEPPVERPPPPPQALKLTKKVRRPSNLA